MARVQEATENFSGTLSNWTQLRPAWGNMAIVGGAVTGPGGALCGIRYSATAPSAANQYCTVTIGAMGFFGQFYISAAGVRCSGSDATRTGYCVKVKDNGSSVRTVELTRVVSGTETVLATTTQTIGNGNKITVEVETSGANALLRCFNDASQIAALDFTDTSPITATGEWGVWGYENTVTSDDADMGTLSTAGPLVKYVVRSFARTRAASY